MAIVDGYDGGEESGSRWQRQDKNDEKSNGSAREATTSFKRE